MPPLHGLVIFIYIQIYIYIFIGYINPLQNVGDWKFEAHNSTEIPDWSSLEEEFKDDIETSEKKSLVWVLGTGAIILIVICGSLIIVWRLIKHYNATLTSKQISETTLRWPSGRSTQNNRPLQLYYQLDLDICTGITNNIEVLMIHFCS